MHPHVVVIYDEIHFFQSQSEALEMFDEWLGVLASGVCYIDTSHPRGLQGYYDMLRRSGMQECEFARRYWDSEVTDDPSVN